MRRWLPVGSNPLQKRSRALVKTLLYRALMIVITVFVTLVITGSIQDALTVGLSANVVKTVTYYTYERAWDRVDWGLGTTEGETG